jgi:hypothetical protein
MFAKVRLFFGYQRDFLRAHAARLDPEVAALLPRLVSILLGVWLILPFDTFDREPAISPFGPLLRLIGLPVTEPYVGLCFLLYGVVGYLALSCNWWRTRRFISAFGSFLWVWIIAFLLIKNPAGILWIFILPLAFCSMFAFIYGPAWQADHRS